MAVDRPRPSHGATGVAQADSAYRSIPTFPGWAANTTVAENVWSDFAQRLDQARTSVDSDRLNAACRMAMRSAAVETGAIEGLYESDRGFTFTVATEAAAWEAVASEKRDFRAHFEAQLAAYELVLDAATRRIPISQAWVRRLHEIACASQDTYVAQTPSGSQQQTLAKGAYKSNPNHVLLPDSTIHAYAPVDETQPEMSRLMDELNSAEFTSAHPVLQTSYAHYALVAIHPFQDGNGRVARALASFYTYRALSLPLVVFADQRPLYYDTLLAADRGECQPFVGFILERVMDTIALVIDNLRTGSTPPEARLAAFRELLTASGGLTHKELDAVARRLLTAATEAVGERIRALQLPPGVRIQVSNGSDNEPAPSGYRHIPDDQLQVRFVNFVSDPPANAHFLLRFEVLIATERTARNTFLVRQSKGDDAVVRLGEIHPGFSTVLQMRLKSWSEGVISSGLESLYISAESSLKGLGYSS